MNVDRSDSQGLNLGDSQNQPIVLSRSLDQTLGDGKFVVLGEIHAPVHETCVQFFSDADLLQPYFDAIVVTGKIKGRPVLSSSEAAGLLRDRNIESVAVFSGQECDLGILHAQLRLAYHRGIRSVVCLTGDSTPNIQLKLNGLEMLRVAANRKDASDRVSLGAVIDPFWQTTDQAILRLNEKTKAGADFVLTQLIFDLSRFKTFCDAMCVAGLDQKTAVIAGIPVVLSAQGLALAERLPDVYLPAEVKKQLLDAPDISACGVAMAKEMIRQIRQIPCVRGVCLMLLGGRNYQRLIEVIHNTA